MSKRSAIKPQSSQTIIGWRERVDLPQWRVSNLLAKCDTGALGSALDVAAIELIAGDRVRFAVVRNRHNINASTWIEAAISGRTRVRSSNGHVQQRLRVLTEVRIGEITKTVEFSLVARSSMLCRILLGRRALAGDFLVDSSLRHQTRKPVIGDKAGS